MTAIEFTKAALDYGLSFSDISVAAGSQLVINGYLGDRESNDEDPPVSELVSRLVSVFKQHELADIIKWAEWVKYADKTDQPGTTTDELVQLRKGYINEQDALSGFSGAHTGVAGGTVTGRFKARQPETNG